MANSYVNKVQKSTGETLIDISDSTAVASDVASGKYFYLATGEKVQGSATGGGGIEPIRAQTIPITNNRTSQITCIRITYDANIVTKIGTYSTNISKGATSNLSFAILKSGIDYFIVFHTSWNVASVSYNGSPLPYATSGSGSQWNVNIYVPSTIDNTIPIILA